MSQMTKNYGGEEKLMMTSQRKGRASSPALWTELSEPVLAVPELNRTRVPAVLAVLELLELQIERAHRLSPRGITLPTQSSFASIKINTTSFSTSIYRGEKLSCSFTRDHIYILVLNFAFPAFLASLLINM